MTGYAAMKPALQKIKVVNQPVRPADSAGPFQRFIAAASTLPGLARGRAVNSGETFNVLVDGQVVGSFRPGGTSYSARDVDFGLCNDGNSGASFGFIVLEPFVDDQCIWW